MKAVQIAATFVAFLISFSVQAACPVQETAVFYGNGTDTKRWDANESKRRLKEELEKQPEFIPECVLFDIAYNSNEPFFIDFFEAGLQKAEELEGSVSSFWKAYLRVINLASVPWFEPLLNELHQQIAANLGQFVLGDQLQEHLVLYREKLAAGRQVIVVGHSQGTLYANKVWLALTPDEQAQLHLVAVATPSDVVADGGDYTTLEEDFFATHLFPFALPANAANEEPCPDEWGCHGFRLSYLGGTNSRTQIVSDIVALLPQGGDTGAVSGFVRTESGPMGGVSVSICRLQVDELDRFCETVFSTTVSASDGRYQFSGLPECSPCRVQVSTTIDGVFFVGHNDFDLGPGSTAAVDVLIRPVFPE